jgi:hypothetical protein
MRKPKWVVLLELEKELLELGGRRAVVGVRTMSVKKMRGSHSGQGIRECFWGKILNTGH